jgi:hypothetical protein
MTTHNLGNILADRTAYEHDRWIAEQARSEWVPLCPEYPNLKGVTCQRIHEFIDEYTAGQPELDDFQTLAIPEYIDAKSLSRPYLEEYLHHIVCLDRDEIFAIFERLGREIATRYPGSIRKYIDDKKDDRFMHSIFVTTPRGGYSALSIFAYANDLSKGQIPSDIEEEPVDPTEIRVKQLKRAKLDMTIMLNRARKDMGSDNKIKREMAASIAESLESQIEDVDQRIVKAREPGKIGVGWLEDRSRRIERIFIVDDILASGKQMKDTTTMLREVFGSDVTIVPVAAAGRRISQYTKRYPDAEKPIIGIATLGIEEYSNSKVRDGMITVRFPWGSPDGTSDLMTHLLYGSRFAGRRGTGSEDVTR